jgi:hypothetical protein
MAYNPVERFNLSGAYSNFTSNSQPNLLIVDDSIKYAQIAENISASASYDFGEADFKHALNATYSNQAANTINSSFTQVEKSITQMNSATLGYRLSYAPADWSNAISMSFTDLLANGVKNTSMGVNFSSSKSLFKKLIKSTLAYSFIQSQSEQGGRQSSIVRLTVGYSYKKHSVNLQGSGNFTKSRSNKSGNLRAQEWMGNIVYSYSFAAAPWKRSQ